MNSIWIQGWHIIWLYYGYVQYVLCIFIYVLCSRFLYSIFLYIIIYIYIHRSSIIYKCIIIYIYISSIIYHTHMTHTHTYIYIYIHMCVCVLYSYSYGTLELPSHRENRDPVPPLLKWRPPWRARPPRTRSQVIAAMGSSRVSCMMFDDLNIGWYPLVI